MADDQYRRLRIDVVDLRDGDVFEWEGVKYRVDVRDPENDTVVIQTNEEIRKNGNSEWEVPLVVTRIDDGQTGVLRIPTNAPPRTDDGDLDSGGPFVDVWR